MKVAFIGFEDIRDPLLWAGIPFALYNKFKEQPDVEMRAICPTLGPIHYPLTVLLKRFFYNKIFGYKFGVYRFDRENWYINLYSKQINEELLEFSPDVILCCTAYQISQLDTDKPIFIYTDATFKLLNTYYPDYMRYAQISVRQSEAVERLALKKATKIIFSSKWAEKSAIEDYQIQESKVSVLPFGSNLFLPPGYEIKLINKIDESNFSMIFVGYDYKRKGLDKAVKIHQRLLSQGINSKLTVIGPDELPPNIPNEGIIFLGKLDKKKPTDYEKLLKAYDEAHFFILPTQVEAFGVVFCEAASLAIPSITHSVGGVDDIIKNGVNGIKLQSDAHPNEFAEKLLAYINNNEVYQRLRFTTYQEYNVRLNWNNTVERMLTIFNAN